MSWGREGYFGRVGTWWELTETIAELATEGQEDTEDKATLAGVHGRAHCFDDSPRPHLPQTGEEHTVTHLQYVAWPDHGVPDDSSDFLEFVKYVRSLRVGGEPALVHCRYRPLLHSVFNGSAPWERPGEIVRHQVHPCPTKPRAPVKLCLFPKNF